MGTIVEAHAAIIVGGGTAGLSTALALARRGLSAVVVERSAYDTWRHGEVLPPDARAPLAELGVWDLLREGGHLRAQSVQSAWGEPELLERHSIMNPFGAGWFLDRARFDAMLAERAEAHGATLLRRTRVRSADRRGAFWRVRLEGAGSVIDARARFLVDATGCARSVARGNGSRPVAFDRLVGVVGVVTPKRRRQELAGALLLETAPCGWWYSVPLPSGSLVVTCMTDDDILMGSGARPDAFWARELARTTYTARRAARGAEANLRVRVRKASSARLTHFYGPGWLAVGDAAASRDPLSGAGITSAMRSGLAAADVMAQRIERKRGAERQYARSMTDEFTSYLHGRARFYGMERRWPDSLFWKRRQTVDPWAVPVSLDPMVTLRARSGSISDAAAAALEGLVPLGGADHLLSLCREPVSAHAIISSFLKRAALPGLDRSGIVALQLLIEQGLIEQVDRA
jgi:flavin-dependent dehydrogenase